MATAEAQGILSGRFLQSPALHLMLLRSQLFIATSLLPIAATQAAAQNIPKLLRLRQDDCDWSSETSAWRDSMTFATDLNSKIQASALTPSLRLQFSERHEHIRGSAALSNFETILRECESLRGANDHLAPEVQSYCQECIGYREGDEYRTCLDRFRRLRPQIEAQNQQITDLTDRMAAAGLEMRFWLLDLRSYIADAQLASRARYFEPGGPATPEAVDVVVAAGRGDTQHCNWFVASVATELGIPYLRDLKPRDVPLHRADKEGRVANQVYEKMHEFAASPASGWLRVDGADEAQRLANQGRFVLGVQHNSEGPGHLMLAVNSKTALEKRPAPHKAPYVMDQTNNVRGAVGVNWAKGSGKTYSDVEWYVYVAPAADKK